MFHLNYKVYLYIDLCVCYVFLNEELIVWFLISLLGILTVILLLPPSVFIPLLQIKAPSNFPIFPNSHKVSSLHKEHQATKECQRRRNCLSRWKSHLLVAQYHTVFSDNQHTCRFTQTEQVLFNYFRFCVREIGCVIETEKEVFLWVSMCLYNKELINKEIMNLNRYKERHMREFERGKERDMT